MQSGTWTITSPAPRTLTPADGRPMTVSEVAERFRLSKAAIRREIERGNLKAYKIASRIRIFEQDIQNWIESQRKPVDTAVCTSTSVTARAAASLARPTPRKRAAPPAGSFRAMVPGADRQGQAA